MWTRPVIPSVRSMAPKQMSIEVEEHHHLYAVFCAVHACDDDPSRENAEKLIETYKKAMIFFSGENRSKYRKGVG